MMMIKTLVDGYRYNSFFAFHSSSPHYQMAAELFISVGFRAVLRCETRGWIAQFVRTAVVFNPKLAK